MESLIQNWLSMLCKVLDGVTRAVVFLHLPDRDDFSPIVHWPDDMAGYQEMKNYAIKVGQTRKCMLLNDKEMKTETGEPLDTIACPLFSKGQLYGVLVLQMSGRKTTMQQLAVQQIMAAVVWFEFMSKELSAVKKGQMVILLELVASCLEHERFQVAATEVMTDVASRLSCDRVSIGFLLDHQVKVEAVSHSGVFDRRSSVFRDIAEAMHEAIVQNSTIISPQEDDAPILRRCHMVLHDEQRIGNVVTVPFQAGTTFTGAVLFERPSDNLFDQTTAEQLQHIVSLIGPVLAIRYRDEQRLPQKIYKALKTSLEKIVGSSSIAGKLGFAVIVLSIVFFSLKQGDYRVTGDARLEARTQQVLVAPQDGYIATSTVRPGDIIHEGDVLGALDDKDLYLEHRKVSSQYEQLEKEYRDALAKHDRATVRIINARINQSKARLDLIEEQLARTRLTAPFDGFIVSGNLSQSLGAPVERGQVLFTVAPLLDYRVILEVDERDIGTVQVGQGGSMVLSGMPGKPLSFTVEKITLVSTAEEGRNFFTVESQLLEKTDLLRPGMEGVAKITVERRKLIWIWTHRLFDWIRLQLWELLP